MRYHARANHVGLLRAVPRFIATRSPGLPATSSQKVSQERTLLLLVFLSMNAPTWHGAQLNASHQPLRTLKLDRPL